MDHELLHNDRGDFDLRLSNKIKKEKEKPDLGERKKWNFRKTSASEASSNDGPSPTFGLINQSSEPRSKKAVSPTMIFENALSDHDENDVKPTVKSPPNTSNISQSSVQQMRSSSLAVDQQRAANVTRVRQRSLPSSTSPPPMINRPLSGRKQGDRLRHASVPASRHQTLLKQQQVLQKTIPSPTQQVTEQTNVQSNNQWQPVRQPFYPVDNLSNVMETPEVDNQPHKARTLSDPIETVDDNRNTMWQGNQEIGNWTGFVSPTNDVFVPDNRGWAGAENVVIDTEDGVENPGNVSHSSRSSNSSESDHEETEESVWRINDEQKAYYRNQFRILQPAEKGVVAGQKARDFFLKSGLGTDVLSKIWNLADLDSDGALNFKEFCIAMHIVVAVRHGLEVPTSLPPYLIPEKYEMQAPNTTTQTVETNSNELSVQDSSQSWARFSPDPRNPNQMVKSETDGHHVQQVTQHIPQPGQHVQPHGQHVAQVNQHAQSTNQHGPQAGHHVQSHGQHAVQVNQQVQSTSQHVQQASQHAQQVRQHAQDNITQQGGQQNQPIAQQDKPVPLPVSQSAQQVSQPTQGHRRLERSMSEHSSADENTSKENTPRKISLGIPRVRGQPKQTNLLDTPHWAILPPPSKFTKENPEDTGKGSLFVPTGTIIPGDHSKQVFVKPEKPDPTVVRESDSSSSDTEDAKERAKSLSQENEDLDSNHSKNSSDDSSVRVSQDSVDGGKKLEAPVPPPRSRSGHSRSSSLDLQKLFNNKAAATASVQNVTDPKDLTPTRETQENFADFSKFETAATSYSNENVARFGHRRSASLDSMHAVFVEPTPQPVIAESVEAKESSNVRHEVSASVPRPVPKKKPASPPPPLRQKKDGQQDSGSDTVIEKEKKTKEPIHFVVKPLTRLEQLHAKIRDLKTKNTRLSRINGELQQELKEMMETRVGLESSLEQLKPFAK